MSIRFLQRHSLNVRSHLFAILLLLQAGCGVYAGPLPTDLVNVRAGSTFVVDRRYDLGRSTWTIPQNVVLVFKENGVIANGSIKGASTVLRAGKASSRILQDLVVEGTWKVDTVYSNWLDFVENKNNLRQTRNLFALCASNVKNTVFIGSGTYQLDSYDSQAKSASVIRIPSNTTVYNQAVFQGLPHANTQSFLFYFRDVTNCTWDGGKIVGDLNGHLSDKGEQGYGFALRGARNITIRNVVCNDFWGDGINLQYLGNNVHNENILIENVKCDGNRRQGISIEDGVHVIVRNSVFSNTGIRRGIAPMRGIDIEPSYEQAVINDILVSGCEFVNNAGGGLACSSIKETDANIVIRNCNDLSGGLRINDCRIRSNAKGLEIVNYQCPDGKLQFKRQISNVHISGSSFMSALCETRTDTFSNVSFDNVRFSTAEQRTWNYYCLSLVCADMKNVTFDHCYFEIRQGSNLSAVLPSGGDWTGAVIRNSEIIDRRSNQMFIPCDIYNSKVECESGLSFTNSKRTSSLFFEGNEVKIRKAVEDSPFIFHSSSNPSYEIRSNKVQSPGRINTNKLVQRYRTNNVEPKVRMNANSFTR